MKSKEPNGTERVLLDETGNWKSGIRKPREIKNKEQEVKVKYERERNL